MLKILLKFAIDILFADGHGENAEVEEENRRAYFSINITDIIISALGSEVNLRAEIYGEQNRHGVVHFRYNTVTYKRENYKRDERKAKQQVRI
jgi:hypothetical protein